MTWKPSARAVSGSLWHCWGWRKQDCQNQKSESCWSRSSMSEAWSTVSSCHRARWSISKSTKRSLFRYPFHPCVTAVARKRSQSFCQTCRWQVTAKHAYTLRMWLCMMWHGAWLYGVHRTCAETAAVSCGTSHASAVSTPLQWIFNKQTKHTIKPSHSCRITCKHYISDHQSINPVAFASLSAQEEWELWQDKLWLLHHDNAPAHNALSIRQFLAKKNIIVLEEPPYSPDLAMCDFSLPQTQGDHQGDLFWRRGGHQEGRNDGADRHPRSIFPAVHRSVAEKDGKVH